MGITWGNWGNPLYLLRACIAAVMKTMLKFIAALKKAARNKMAKTGSAWDVKLRTRNTMADSLSSFGISEYQGLVADRYKKVPLDSRSVLRTLFCRI